MRTIAARVLPVPTSIVSILSFITNSGDVLRRATRPAVSQFNRRSARENVPGAAPVQPAPWLPRHGSCQSGARQAGTAHAPWPDRECPGAFDIDSAFKLVGDDPDFFHRGAGGRPAGRGFDPLHPHLYGNFAHATNLLLIKIVRFRITLAGTGAAASTTRRKSSRT